MLDIRTNYRGQHVASDKLCPVCAMEEDTQQHILVCDMLCKPDSLVKNDELFGDELDKNLRVSRILKHHCKKRKQLLN